MAPEDLEILKQEQQLVAQRQEATQTAALPDDKGGEDYSAIERLFANRPAESISTRIRQYGYELFSQSPSIFAPVEDMPVPDDYVLGPGDELVIRVASVRRGGEHTLTIDRQGSMFYPGIGSLPVAGMTYPQIVAFLNATRV